MRYPGGKSSDGVYQNIINQIPPHRVYIEGFLGGGAILLKKRPAEISIGIDRDPEIIRQWEHEIELDFVCTFHCRDFIKMLASIETFDYTGVSEETFLYLDPPYLPETRSSSAPLYKFEMNRAQHIELLNLIRDRREMIMISGYRSALYNELLANWRTVEYNAMTRGGKCAREVLYMNYPEPEKLHDFNFLGTDSIDRQRIKRKRENMIRKIRELPQLERLAFLQQLAPLLEKELE